MKYKNFILSIASFLILFFVFFSKTDFYRIFFYSKIDSEKYNLELANLLYLSEENKDLKSKINFLYEEGTNDTEVYEVKSDVLSISYDQGKTILVLAKGRDSNVKTGCFVSRNNNFIGLVYSIKKSTSFVHILNSSDFNIEAEVKDANVKGVLEYSLDGLFLKEIPSNKNLSEGAIITTIQTEDMPKKFVVGVVSSIIKNESSPTFSAEISPALNFENLGFVNIYCKK